MSSAAAAIVKPPTIRTFELTGKHLSDPDAFAPPERESFSDKRVYVNFTISESKPICSITQETLNLGETIAACQVCFAAFLARNLKRHFLSLKTTKTPSLCPVCRVNLNETDLKLPHLENLRMLIDLIKEKIILLELELKNTERAFEESKADGEDNLNLIGRIDDPDDNEDLEMRKLLSEFQDLESKSLEKSNDSFLRRIEEFKKSIQMQKTELAKMETLENSFTSKIKSQERKELFRYLRNRTAVVSVISLLIFGSFKIIQNKIFCVF
ncbi:MAG: hypothetical protein K1060chlam1_00023 [Candidatus Anoxychlamydiales bacterium]|nr:hypothetical protein [Candidatus Anoxychlamydiales bacterium]